MNIKINNNNTEKQTIYNWKTVLKNLPTINNKHVNAFVTL